MTQAPSDPSASKQASTLATEHNGHNSPLSATTAQKNAVRPWKWLLLLTILAALSFWAWQAFQPKPSPLLDAPFVQLNQKPIDPAQLQGKVVLVNFWATSCVSCVAEMPDLIKTHQKFQAQGYETVAVAMAYDSPQFVQQFVQTRKLPFMIAWDSDGSLAKKWGNIQLTPTTFLLDKQGQIVKQFVGPPNFEQLHRQIAQLLQA